MKKGILAFVVSVFVLSFVSCGKTNKLCSNGSNTENEVKAEELKTKEDATNKESFLSKKFELLEGKTVTSADLEKWFKEAHGDITKNKMNPEQKALSDYIESVKEKELKAK
ncbi:hypothetical protein AGMMS49532_02260 [Endomicrobiia bacterium]|nr:hypothetical protein AGMMS49532_02260 [Endomicrobiia bacterium]